MASAMSAYLVLAYGYRGAKNNTSSALLYTLGVTSRVALQITLPILSQGALLMLAPLMSFHGYVTSQLSPRLAKHTLPVS